MSQKLNKILNRETISYIVFGVLTTAVSIAAYFIFSTMLKGFFFRVSAATVLSWVFAVSFAFITNKLFVFNSKSMAAGVILKEAFAFVCARIASLGAELVWMVVTVDICYRFVMNFSLLVLIGELIGMDKFDLYQLLMKCIANVFVLIINYVLSKMFVFNYN